MNHIMRAFKSSLYDPKVGKYKVETSAGRGKLCEVKWYTEEEFDALCDEADREYEAELAKRKRKSEEAAAARLECEKQAGEYITKCANLHSTLKHEDYNCFHAKIIGDKLEVTPVWISDPSEEMIEVRSCGIFGDDISYAKKTVRCIVAENEHLRHVPAFGGKGYFYHYIIVDADDVDEFGVDSTGFFTTRESLKRAIEKCQANEISALESKIYALMAEVAKKKAAIGNWKF